MVEIDLWQNAERIKKKCEFEMGLHNFSYAVRIMFELKKTESIVVG